MKVSAFLFPERIMERRVESELNKNEGEPVAAGFHIVPGYFPF